MCMGPPQTRSISPRPPRVYPHVYGATPGYITASTVAPGLSPCVWGHHSNDTDGPPGSGSIPMCVGPPRWPLQLLHRQWAYPHVYGATLPVVMAPARLLGRSPSLLV